MKKSRRIAAAAAVSLTLLTSASAPASAGPTTRLDAWLARSAACALWNMNNPIWLTGGPVWYLCREELLAQLGWAPLRGVAARTFNKPHEDGDRVAACLIDGRSCGKPVADRLCEARGFQRTLTFRMP